MLRPFDVRVEIPTGNLDLCALASILEAFDASVSPGLDGRLVVEFRMYGHGASDARASAWSIAVRATGATPLVCELTPT